MNVSRLGWLTLSLMVGRRGDRFTMSSSSLWAVLLAPSMCVGIECVITAGGGSENVCESPDTTLCEGLSGVRKDGSGGGGPAVVILRICVVEELDTNSPDGFRLCETSDRGDENSMPEPVIRPLCR